MDNVVNLTARGVWAIPATGFVNPTYLSALAGGAVENPSKGFEISPFSTVVIAFAGTYTGQTVVHEQTLDPEGVLGWFSVEGSPNTGGSATSAGSTSGVAYTFSTTGVRHRVTVSALSTGTIQARVLLDNSGVAVTGGGGGGGGGDVNITEVNGNAVDTGLGASGTGTLRVAISSDSPVSSGALVNTAAPTYLNGATQPLSLTTKAGLRSTIQDGSGVEVDFTAPVEVIGTGSAGAPSPSVVTIQGIATGTDIQVGGQSADGATQLGVPIPVAGKFTTTPPSYTNNQSAQLRVTAKGDLSVGGAIADDAAAGTSANTYPVPVGGIFQTTLPTYTTGDRTQLQFTSRGEAVVGGSVASGSADFGNPVKAGMKYVAAGLSALTGGERVDLQSSDRGYLKVVLASPSSATGLVQGQTAGDDVSQGNNFLCVQAQTLVYDGTNGDRLRSIGGSFGSAVGVAAVEQAGATFSYISGANTTQVKSGAGILHKIIVNTLVGAGTINVIDNTSGSTTNIALISLPATVTALSPFALEYDLSFATGLRIITSGATDITVVYR